MYSTAQIQREAKFITKRRREQLKQEESRDRESRSRSRRRDDTLGWQRFPLPETGLDVKVDGTLAFTIRKKNLELGSVEIVLCRGSKEFREGVHSFQLKMYLSKSKDDFGILTLNVSQWRRWNREARERLKKAVANPDRIEVADEERFDTTTVN